MQRLALGLALLLICGAVSAEQMKPAVKAATKPPAAPSGIPKQAAKKPVSSPPAKMLFGGVTAPAPLAARAIDGWPGLFIGDMAQPRGGPMTTCLSRHQIRLAAYPWPTPMPDQRASC